MTQQTGSEPDQGRSGSVPQPPCHFSVVIPTYAGAKRLVKVLRRLQMQVVKEGLVWEILVCDNNGSNPVELEGAFEINAPGIEAPEIEAPGIEISGVEALGETLKIVQQFQTAQGHLRMRSTSCPPPLLRHCWVTERGAAFARQQGVEQAQGEWVGFLDDDNWPAPDWVNQACLFVQTHHSIYSSNNDSNLGAIGSQIQAAFEPDSFEPDSIEPNITEQKITEQKSPPGFEQIAPYLAIVERGDQPQEYERHCRVLPPGAGLVVRRSAWLQAVPPRLFLNHTARDRGLASEDLEALIYLRQAGWQVWYNPTMLVHHHIPSARLEPQALQALFRRIGLSRHHLRMLKLNAALDLNLLAFDRWAFGLPRLMMRSLLSSGVKVLVQSLATLLYAANDSRKLLRVLLQERASNGICSTQCDRTYLIYSLLSPSWLGAKAFAQFLNPSPVHVNHRPSSPVASSVADSLQNQRVQITLAIPTHNGEKRLPRLLEALSQQQLPEGLGWEILLIDNASEDSASEDSAFSVVETWNAQRPSGWPPIFYVEEPQKGLTFARQRAVEMAQGDWIAFLDDDTQPDSSWLAEVWSFCQLHPRIGAFGGRIEPEYEVEPPAGFERIASFLAVKQLGDRPQRYRPERLQLPAGAGLVTRRQAWLQSIPTQLHCTQGSGEDFAISCHLHRAGWEIWYNPAMRLTHDIPAWRLERQSLLALSWRVGCCVCSLRLIGLPVWWHPWIRVRVLGGNLKRLLHHWARHHRFVGQQDTVVACETAFFLSGMLSAIKG